jgi:2'-phosphotransferase
MPKDAWEVLTLPQLEHRTIKPLKVSLQELKDVVAEDDKKRYSLIPALDHQPFAPLAESSTAAATVAGEVVLQDEVDSDYPEDFLIRANQGHSIELKSEELLKPIQDDNIPDMAVHGTTEKAWGLILKSGGLRRMGRNHIHFASGLPAGFCSIMSEDEEAEKKLANPSQTVEKLAPPVISGMRSSSSILIYIDIRKARSAGLKFWLSDNGVILSEGDERGFMKTEFFQQVEDRKARKILMKDGALL